MPRWFLWTWFALASWGVWAVLSKVIGDALSPAHSQALSSLGILPVLVVLAFLPGSPPAGNPRAARGAALALTAGIVTSLGNLAYYDALQRGERAVTVIPLTALYPIVTVALAVVLLHERLGNAQKLGAALCLLATYLFNVPDEHGLLSSAVVHAVPPILLWGLSGFLQKLATLHLSGERSAMFFLAAALPVSAVILARDPLPDSPLPIRVWTLVVALGMTLAAGNLAVLLAFARGGKASVIAPLAGLYPLISLPIAILALGERASPRELAAFAAALAAVVALALEPSTRSHSGPPAPDPNPSTPLPPTPP
jgi:transporter family protein